MKTLLSVTIAVALTLAGIPATAENMPAGGEVTAIYHAFSQLSVEQQATLTPLSVDQLAAVEAGELSITLPDLFLPDISTCPFVGPCLDLLT